MNQYKMSGARTNPYLNFRKRGEVDPLIPRGHAPDYMENSHFLGTFFDRYKKF